jgi:hypothetical protein
MLVDGLLARSDKHEGGRRHGMDAAIGRQMHRRKVRKPARDVLFAN